ncbi:hypothetical protein TIFTF001_011135 [Ficus carica]|uniref:Uncharacterized protein n=1 Tax=Ficus carica TaxID=3494 RepID=A0AA88D3Z1_FICCA|nr:hypothetical protein TIFTF001_011135 [Ficus carica]
MEETSTPPSHELNPTKILSESNRIINFQPRNFVFLAALFVFPSIAAVIYLVYQYPVAISDYFLTIISTNSFGPDHQDHIANIFRTPKTFLLPLAFAFLISLFTLSAVGSITYTAFHAFHGQPVKLKSAFMSIKSSFFPLLGTTLLVRTIISSIIIIFAVILLSMFHGARSLGFHITVYSPYFLASCMAAAILFTSVVTYLHANWSLASVIVVAESTWGFEALKRSASLIKGRRRLFLSVSYVLWFSQVMLVLSTNHFWLSTSDIVWKQFFLLVATQVLMMSISLTLSQLFCIVANTVLYVYCKAIHDGEEFPGPAEYVRLPVQDKKVAGREVSYSVPLIVVSALVLCLIIIFQTMLMY